MPNTKRANKKAPKLSRAGKDIVAGLKEATAHVRGELSLRNTSTMFPGRWI